MALNKIGNVAREKKGADYLYASTDRGRIREACEYWAVWGWGETAQGRRRSGVWAVRVVSKGSTGFWMEPKGRTPLSNEAGPKEGVQTNKDKEKHRGVEKKSHVM